MSRISTCAFLAFLLLGCAPDASTPEERIGHAALSVTVSPPFAMDTPVDAPAQGIRELRDIAFDGSTYLVVWRDWSTRRHFVARISSSGSVLDPRGIDLGRGDTVNVVAGAGVFLLAVDDEKTQEVRLQVLTPAGTLVAGDALLSPAGVPSVQALAYDGTNFAAVWTEGDLHTHPYTSRFSRISPAGALLDPGGIILFDSSNASDMAFDGTNYLVVHAGGEGLGKRVSPQGVILDPLGFPLYTPLDPNVDMSHPRVRFDGTNWIIAYALSATAPMNAMTSVYLTRVSPQGFTLDPAGVPLLPPKGIPGYDFSLAADPMGVLVAWSDRKGKQGIKLEVLDGALAPVDTKDVAVPGRNPFLSSDGTNRLLAWAAPQGSIGCWAKDENCWAQSSIVFSRLDAANTLLDTPPILVSGSDNTQRAPSVAWDGQNFLVSWTDSRSFADGTYWDARAARVSPAGQVLDPSGIALEVGAGWTRETATSFDGQEFLVTWSECLPDPTLYFFPWTCSLQARRVNHHGVPASNPPLLLGGVQQSEGEQFLAASPGIDGIRILTTNRKPANFGEDLWSAAADSSGLVSPPLVVPTSSTNGLRAISFDGTNHLAVWAVYTDLFALRVDAQGMALDASPIHVAQTDYLRGISAVFDGQNHSIVYLTDDGKIGIARVRPDGVALDPAGIDVFASADYGWLNSSRYVAAAFDGQHIVVAWESFGLTGRKILGAVIAPNGQLIRDFAITDDAEEGTEAALAAGSNGKILAIYASLRSKSPNAETYRLVGRMLDVSAEWASGAGGAGGNGGGSGSAGGNGGGSGGSGGGENGGGSGSAGGNGGGSGGSGGAGPAGAGGSPDAPVQGSCTTSHGPTGGFSSLWLLAAILASTRQVGRSTRRLRNGKSAHQPGPFSP